jgi:cytochrome c-type biogenesis protein CcmH/NrfG
MFKTVMLSLLVAAPLAAAPAAANPSDKATAQNAAVSTLENYTRVAPSDGGAFIELAQAYTRANRPVEATAAYRRALELDNVMMVTSTGDSVWSHQIARAALSRVQEVTAR